MPDGCHNVKLARNALGDLKVIHSLQGQVKWAYIVNLHQLQKHLTLKLANKISSAHVNWKANPMKVKLAAQTLSSSTATALEFLQNWDVEDFKECDATIDFLRSFAKGFKKAIYLNILITYRKGCKKKLDICIRYGG